MTDLVENAECPGCGARQALQPEPSLPLARSCRACGGWFLARRTARRFFIEELGLARGHIERLLETPGPRQRRCPGCAKAMSEVILHRDDVDICASCGGAWLPPGVMERLSRGAYGSSSSGKSVVATSAPSPFGPPPSAPPPSPFGPPPSTTAPRAPVVAPPPTAPSTTLPTPSAAAEPSPAPSVAAPTPKTSPSARAAPSSSSSASPSNPSLARAHHVETSGPRATSKQRQGGPPYGTGAAGGGRGKLFVAGGAVLGIGLLGVLGFFALVHDADEEVVVAVTPPSASEKYGSYLRHYRFGGRNLDWWSTRLTELSPGGSATDERMYALTKARAERLGLVVSEQAGRVEVTLSEALVTRLLERLEVR